MLEIDAGTGQDSAYFQEEGFAVVAAELSAVMVEHCRAKGIEAYAMDFLHLNFPVGSFDTVFAMNCLLHVPNHDLPAVLAAVRTVLRPGGLFFVGVYGGNESAEGPIDDDEHVPWFRAASPQGTSCGQPSAADERTRKRHRPAHPVE